MFKHSTLCPPRSLLYTKTQMFADGAQKVWKRKTLNEGEVTKLKFVA